MLIFLLSHSRLLFSKETVSDPGKRAPSVYEAKASKTLAIHPFWYRSKENMTTNTLQEVPAVPVLSIIVTDAGGKITSFSEGAEKLFGWKASEVVGKSVATMHTEQGVKEFGKILGDAANGRYEGSLAFKKKNGQTFQAHLQVLATKDKTGKVNSYIGITYQI